MHAASLAPAPLPPLAPPPVDVHAHSLFFDVDGTLVELAETPDAVIVPERLLGQLARLADAFPGRTALVSGRSIAQIDAMLGAGAAVQAVAGSHGAERRLASGEGVAAERPAALAAVDAVFSDFAQAHRLVFEPKSLGSALHYRAQPEREAAATRLAEELAATHGLVLQRGKMMVELRAAGDKGAAIDVLLATPAMAGTRPLFFGDDVTDEAGFRAAAAAGGAGVLVGEARPTAARYRLPDVAAVGWWIDSVLEKA